jgi:hypothetical protein
VHVGHRPWMPDPFEPNAACRRLPRHDLNRQSPVFHRRIGAALGDTDITAMPWSLSSSCWPQGAFVDQLVVLSVRRIA